MAVGRGSLPRPSAADLRRLVTRAKAGDQDAVDALYRLHVDRIYAYLAANVGNQHDAEDLTTQTFMRMIESLDRFQPRATPFAAWLFRIARNLAIDHFRAAARARARAQSGGGATPRDASAEDEALSVLDREVLREELATLPLGQREVLTLKFVCGLTNAEVASVLSKTEGAVKALERRALRTLQRRPIRAA
ncbi:MAG: sigma-70 family RNA polymerase sigma factor [Actinobacteria bacterium]|nr:MAG: sigma-70 family RNA polymerase sigma factor [Actinomycetota bacterium]